MSGQDDDKFDDALPTTIDPGVPTGARARPEQFDPHARLKDNRAAIPAGGRPVAAEVISALKPVRHDDPIPAKTRAPSNFDPSGRIDDSSRTAKWAPRELENSGRAEQRASAESPTRVEGSRAGRDGAAGAPPRGLALPLAAPPRTHVGPMASPPHPAQVDVPSTPRDRSEPMRVISMKTPADLEAEEKAQRALPVVKLRAISEVHRTPARGMGNLAPPRDAREARSRRLRDNVIWGSLAVILASVVTLAIWFLARR